MKAARLLYLALFLGVATAWRLPLAMPTRRLLQQTHGNSLCSPAADGTPAIGGYVPMPASDVPATIAKLIADAFLTANQQQQMWADCPKYEAKALEACSQVVAGTNYKLLVKVTCKAARFANGVKSAVLEGEAYKPLPSSGEQPQVLSAELQRVKPDVVLAESLPVGAAQGGQSGEQPRSLLPPGEATLCTIPSQEESLGGYFPMDKDHLPQDLAELVAKRFLKNKKNKRKRLFTGCTGTTSKVVDGCSQIVAGTNYLLAVEVTCDEGSWDNGLSTVTLQALVYKPLPAENEGPKVLSVKAQG